MWESAVQAGAGEEAAQESPAVCEISVMVDAGGTQAFSIVLGSDGSIRRRRAASAGEPASDTLIGTANPGLFEQVRSMITPQLLRWCRPMRSPSELRGELRELEVRLKQSDGQELRSRWECDAEPSGPPAQVIEFAAAAVQATNRWYEEQKAKVRRPARSRSDWHLVS